MSRLWVPPSVSREHREQTERHKAEVIEAAMRDATCDWWDRELQKLDPALTLIKAHPDAEVPGLKPGYWHIVRDCTPAPPALLPLVGDDGEYVEPTSRIFDLLRAGDLQNPRAIEDRRRKDEINERRKQAEEQQGHEDRVEEMMDRWRAATQTRVSMNQDTPWSQNVAGRRGAKQKTGD